MTWIDERLFGWSRSSKRGTSAWGGPVDDISRINTPDDSDEEDTGDYDNVVGLVDSDGGLKPPSQQKSRSRQGSYADLQRLRMAPTSKEQSPHRVRRASLTDGVTVKRLSEINPEAHFDDATQDINAEIEHTKTK